MDLDNLYKRKPTSLMSAVCQENIEAVRDLLEKGVAHPNSADHRGWTALHEAASKNQLEIVKILLDDERTNPDANAHDGDLALNVAVKSKASVELVDCLARCTTHLCLEKYTDNLLEEAICGGSADIVKYLITNTPVNIQGSRDNCRRSPVAMALEDPRTNEEVLKVLLDACDDVNKLYLGNTVNSRKIILFALDARCSLSVIKLIIDRGALLNYNSPVRAFSFACRDSLLYAIEKGRTDVALELVKHNVEVNRNINGTIAVAYSISTKDVDLVTAILQHTSFRCLEKLSERYGFNGLICLALSEYDEKILSLLLNCRFSEKVLEAPVHINFVLARPSLSYRFAGPLSFLLKEKINFFGNETLSIMKLLLSKGISIEPRKEGYMPSLVALLVAWPKADDSSLCKQVLRMLLDLGVNVDYRSGASLPDALLTAVHTENLEAVLMLLPYSQYTPCDLGRIGIETKMYFVWKFVWENMNAMDDFLGIQNFQEDEDLLHPCRCKVLPLTVLARRKVRQSLPTTETSSEFLNIIEKLEVPETVKCFLRFL